MIFSKTPSLKKKQKKKHNSNLFLRAAYSYRDWCLQAPLQADELVENTPQYYIEFKSLISDVLTLTLIMSKQMLFYFCSWFIYSVLKQGKSIIEHRKPILFPIYKKKKVQQKVYIAIFKMVNIIEQKQNINFGFV